MKEEEEVSHMATVLYLFSISINEAQIIFLMAIWNILNEKMPQDVLQQTFLGKLNVLTNGMCRRCFSPC